MRRLAGAIIGSLILACTFGLPAAQAQTSKKATNQTKAPAKPKPAPKAEWRAPPLAAPAAAAASPSTETTAPLSPEGEAQNLAAAKATADAALASPEGLRAVQALPAEAAEVAKPVDESEELLTIDRAFAANLVANGPLKAYEAMMSAEGVLHDASGSSPAGAAGAQARFGTFPADVTLERSPESAMAAGGSGSSWGRYVIRRGDNQLSLGRYVTVWRREAGGWLIVTELAAGRAGPQAAAAPGPLPRKPPSVAPRPPASTPRN